MVKRSLHIALLVVLASLYAHGQNYDNLYCPPGGTVPTWGLTDDFATLPTLCWNTLLSSTPTSGAVVNVSSAAQLTTALATLTCGQQITIAAGSVISGNFTVPGGLSCDALHNYVYIQSSAVASLPAEGARYSTPYRNLTLYLPQFGPCYAGVTSLPGRPTFNCPVTPGTYTAQISTPNTSAALTIGASFSGIRIIGIEFTRATGSGLVNDLISSGDSGAVDHIVLDRVWCHGTELGDETNRCLRDNTSNFFAVQDSYLNDFYCVSVAGACTDSKAIGGGTNTFNSVTEGPTKIVNNFLEASGENLLHGGGGSNTITADFEIRLNSFFKPLTWLPIDPSYNGGYKGGHPVIVKNSFEMKNMQRALIEGNMFVNTWGGFTQHGQSLTFNATNQSGNCPICFVSDITVRYNYFSTANSFGIFSIEFNAGNALPVTEANASIHDNIVDNIAFCGANSSYCPSSQSNISNTTATTLGAPHSPINHFVWNHNTFVYASGATNRNAIGLSGPTIASGFVMNNMKFTNNVMQAGGGETNANGGSDVNNCANGQSGPNIITQCWSPETFGNNCIVNNGVRTWPGSNVTSVASYSTAFVNFNNGFGGNYTIAAGACKNAASDGADPGANVALVASVLAGGTPIASPSNLRVTPGARLLRGVLLTKEDFDEEVFASYHSDVFADAER